MAFSFEQFKEICLLLKNGQREQVQPADDFDQIDIEALNFFAAIATPVLIPFILYPITQLAEAGSGTIGLGETALNEVNDRRKTLNSILVNNKPITAQFVSGLKNTDIIYPESNLDVWANIFSNSILRIVDFESWSEPISEED